jgi:NlpC/P60 family putative phage cell wall peptidase
MTATRADVVAEARSWRRTPYRLAQDVKGVGVDCALLLLRVYADLGLIEPFDPRPYPADWMLHRSEEKFLKIVLARAHEISPDQAEPGDVVLFRVARCFAHGGIITIAKPLTVVHAYSHAWQVVEERADQSAIMARQLKTAKFASYWEK